MVQFEWDPAKVGFHFLEGQEALTGEGDETGEEFPVLQSYELLKQSGKRLANANLLYFMFRNQTLVSEKFRGLCLIFWGTEYLCPDTGPNFLCLDWNEREERFSYFPARGGFNTGLDARSPAVILL